MYIPMFILGIFVGIILTFISAYLFVRYEEKGKHGNSDSKKNIHGKLDELNKNNPL